MCCSVVVCCSVKQCCSLLQCVVVCCSVLHCVALCCTVLHCVAESLYIWDSVYPPRHQRLWCVWQCVAVCCSVLQYDAENIPFWNSVYPPRHTATHCNTMQHLFGIQSNPTTKYLLQYVAVCCSVMRYVAMCCRKFTFLGFSLPASTSKAEPARPPTQNLFLFALEKTLAQRNASAVRWYMYKFTYICRGTYTSIWYEYTNMIWTYKHSAAPWRICDIYICIYTHLYTYMYVNIHQYHINIQIFRKYITTV